MGRSAPVDAGAQLGNVRCPALIIEGRQQPGRSQTADRRAALAELGDARRDALQGRSGRDALAAARTIRAYVLGPPGRYAATIRLDADSPDDPVAAAGARTLGSLSTVLAGYKLDPADTAHALRLLRSLFHGFVAREAAGGFELDTDVDESFEWLIGFVDRGLTP